MNDNKAFWKAVHSLAHPVTLLAVILLIFNDHYLRHKYPSWLTGKLGDFTWLVFAPFILAILLAWIIPRRIRTQQQIAGWLAISLIGLWFATAKTIPIIHSITTTGVEYLIGWEGTLRIDPTDLLTLPALFISRIIWKQSNDHPGRLKAHGWLILSLGVVGTLASTDPYYPSTNEGITCINKKTGKLVAYVEVGSFYYTEEVINFDRFTSTDGGLTWEVEHIRNDPYTPEPAQRVPNPIKSDDQPECISQITQVSHPDDPEKQFRYTPGQHIEISTDGGQSWSVLKDLFELHQEARYLYYGERTCSWPCDQQIIKPGPHDMVIDDTTGNLVLAMGWDGVLVYTPDARWHWVRVDKYYLGELPPTPTANQIQNQRTLYDDLTFEMWLAFALGFLILTTGSAYIDHAGKVRYGLLSIGWLGWLFLVSIISPLATILYGVEENSLFIIAALILLFFLAIPMILYTIIQLAKKKFQHVIPLLIMSITSGLVYLFPYTLWRSGTVPRYQTARIFALMLTVGAMGMAFTGLRRIAQKSN